VKGLISPKAWLNKNFKKTPKGYLVYKAFGQHYPSPWTPRPNRWIEEPGVNPDRGTECGSGVNFGTLRWDFGGLQVWECLLAFEDLPTLVVPINGGNKARCARLKILRRVDIKKLRASKRGR
jgi:hypothetical protein